MSDPDDRQQRKSFEARLREAQARRRKDTGREAAGGRGSSEGMAVGFRIAVEMIAALGVGVGIGIGLDRWLGTTPWLLILFFILGAGAALLNVIRVAKDYERRVERRRKAQDEERS